MPARRSPQCRTCGEPMAGHKRPHGFPICPEQEDAQAAPGPILQRGATIIGRHGFAPEPGVRLPLNGHWRNPYWVEPAPRIEDDRSSHSSWVPTDIDGESAEEESQGGSEGRVLAELNDDGDDARSTSSTASSVSTTLTQLMGNSIALASVWSTPTRDIPAIGQAAAKAGVSFGVVSASKYRRGRALKREGSRNDADALERQNSLWVVMGQDKLAVERMIAKAEGGAEGQEDEEQDPCTSGLVGAYPIHYSYLRPTFLDVLIAGAVGGFVVFYALAVF
ncbi:hypothetical protein FOMPIDRAFT_1125687 [Fomitopsis schrenkii]|uniref:Uncharacterized protein n=1 Tax=Fomitopsis schrenkii TaxID=2126942 RepID=S8E0Q0_FOMSC|nr:hypothetical protein FOMPIDRAFT_1125687 [Fomitopsis schrenkii]